MGGIDRAGPRTSRWLVFAEEAVVPVDAGGRSECLSMLRALADSGIDLHVVLPGVTGPALERHRAALPGVGMDGTARRGTVRSLLSTQPYVLVSRPVTRDLAAVVRAAHERGPFTAVVALTFRAVRLGEFAADALDLPLLVRPHNMESAYFADLARSSRGPRRLAYRAEAAKLRRAEARAHRSPSISVFADISAADAVARRRATAIPVRHEPPFLPVPTGAPDEQAAPVAGPSGLLFVGSMDNANNRSAISWFVESCRPGIDGSVSLDVVGRRVAPEFREWLASRGVRVTSDAPSLEPHLRAAAVFVNPMRRGSGVNIKMVEAMAAGLPVVSTSVGARGLPWRDGEHLLVADSPEAFASAVGELLASPARRAALAEAGRAFVREHLDPGRRVADLRAAVETGARSLP